MFDIECLFVGEDLRGFLVGIGVDCVVSAICVVLGDWLAVEQEGQLLVRPHRPDLCALFGKVSIAAQLVVACVDVKASGFGLHE